MSGQVLGVLKIPGVHKSAAACQRKIAALEGTRCRQCHSPACAQWVPMKPRVRKVDLTRFRDASSSLWMFHHLLEKLQK